MSNVEKYDNAFADSLAIDRSLVRPGLQYNEAPGWDSIGHMALVSALEDTFSLSMETSDIVELGSYEKGIEIMRKYGVSI